MRGVFFIPFVFLWTGIAAQKSSKNKVAPPGTVRVNDTLYVDKTEVANVHWREYLFYLQRFDSMNQDIGLPDTTVWEAEPGFFGMPFSQLYFRHPAFNNYPAVGISFTQAIAFCKWRTFAANQALYFKENKIMDWELHTNDTFPIRFFYRLPSVQEWETIAAGKDSTEQYPYGYPGAYVKWRGKNTKAFNCNYIPGEWKSGMVSRYHSAPVNSFFKNTSGVYNMIGNVAEMVSEKGIAKGGSFDHTLDECKIVNNQYYTKPERWLGFRCVAVIIK